MTPSTRPTIYRVRRPDTGQIGEVEDHNLDQAIAMGGEVIDDLLQNEPANQSADIVPQPSDNSPIVQSQEPIAQQSPSNRPAIAQEPEKMYKVKRPDTGEIGEVSESNLEKAKQMGGEVVQDLDLKDRALQFGSGAASLLGSAADLSNQFVASPALNLVGGAAELAAKGAGLVSSGAEDLLNKGAEKAYAARDYYKNTHVAEQAEHGVESIAGKDISPQDPTGRIVHTAGEFAVPVGNVTKGAKTVVEFGKALGKHLGVAAAGAIAPETTVSEKGTVLSGIEEFLQTISFMVTTDKALSTSKKDIINKVGSLINSTFNKTESSKNALSSIKEVKKELGETGSNLVGKVLSLGSKPASDFNAIAKAENIDLPFNVALGGRFKNFLSNTIFQSLFTNKLYHEVVENADASMIKAVRDKIDNIGSFSTYEQASSNAADFLKSEESAIGKKVKKLYKESDSLITPKDKVKLNSTISSIEEILPQISAPSPSDDMSFVASRIAKIGKSWGLLPDLSKYKDAPEVLIEQIKKNWKKSTKEIPVQEVITQLKALNKDLNYEKNIKGVKNNINKIIGALEKDLASSPNKEHLKKRKIASTYFKENEAARIRTDIARSIMTGEVPKEAISYMGSVGQIRKLSKIVGESKNGKEIMSSLKRAKAQDIVLDNLIDNVGTISYAKFATLFNKSQKNQVLLKEVLGESYEPLKKLSGVAQEFVRSGKMFGNASRTTLAAQDIKHVTSLIKTFLVNASGVAATIGGSAKGGLVGAGLGALEPAAIYFLSKNLANKGFINNAVKYAEAKRLGTKGEKVFADRISRFIENQFKEIPNYPQVLNHMFAEYAETKRKREKENEPKSK